MKLSAFLLATFLLTAPVFGDDDDEDENNRNNDSIATGQEVSHDDGETDEQVEEDDEDEDEEQNENEGEEERFARRRIHIHLNIMAGSHKFTEDPPTTDELGRFASGTARGITPYGAEKGGFFGLKLGGAIKFRRAPLRFTPEIRVGLGLAEQYTGCFDSLSFDGVDMPDSVYYLQQYRGSKSDLFAGVAIPFYLVVVFGNLEIDAGAGFDVSYWNRMLPGKWTQEDGMTQTYSFTGFQNYWWVALPLATTLRYDISKRIALKVHADIGPVLFGRTSLSLPIYDALGWLTNTGPIPASIRDSHQFNLLMECSIRTGRLITIVPGIWVSGMRLGRSGDIRLKRPDYSTMPMVTGSGRMFNAGGSVAVDFGFGKTVSSP